MTRCALPRTRKLAREDGFTMIELLAAILVLTIGILGSMSAFGAADKLSLVNERHAAMTQIAQREIERIESLAYTDIGLDCGGSSGNTCPQASTNAANPDYFVGAGGSTFEWNRSTGSSESLDIDATNGTIVPFQTWNQTSNQGLLSGDIYDFITWSTDSNCSPGCPASQDYKRITVAVTMTTGLQPDPVYVSSVISDPGAAPTGSVANQQGNPLTSPNVNCTTGTGTTGPCTSGLENGSANTYFLHDWAATNSGSPQTPSADNTTDKTVGSSPVPDLMDTNTPSGTTNTPLYNYSTDQCSDTTNCYPGGRELVPTGVGTDATSDCAVPAWSSSMPPDDYELWVTPALSSEMTLTGDGGLTLYTQTINPGGMPPAINPLVSLCAEIYQVSSLSNVNSPAPTALGGAAYVGPTDPTSGGNWPTSASQITFDFTFAQNSVSVPSGDRIGLLLWEKSEPSPGAPVDLIYDNPNYQSQLQLNSQ